VFGINGGEFVVLAVLGLLIIGPDRLPEYAAQLGRFVREARRMARGARDQVRAEMGPDFDDVDWRKLDPRQYDPRRIVREALADTLDDPPSKPRSRGLRAEGYGPGAHDEPGPAPYDDEAT
jgi:sec-independent protein translocase protein TatB